MGDWPLWAGFALLFFAWIHPDKQRAAACAICSFFYIFGYGMEPKLAGEAYYWFFVGYDAFWAATLLIWSRGPRSCFVICLLNSAILGYLPLWLHGNTANGFRAFWVLYPVWYLPLQIALISCVSLPARSYADAQIAES